MGLSRLKEQERLQRVEKARGANEVIALIQCMLGEKFSEYRAKELFQALVFGDRRDAPLTPLEKRIYEASKARAMAAGHN